VFCCLLCSCVSCVSIFIAWPDSTPAGIVESRLHEVLVWCYQKVNKRASSPITLMSLSNTGQSKGGKGGKLRRGSSGSKARLFRHVFPDPKGIMVCVRVREHPLLQEVQDDNGLVIASRRLLLCWYVNSGTCLLGFDHPGYYCFGVEP
jgi:hypothetical protein